MNWESKEEIQHLLTNFRSFVKDVAGKYSISEQQNNSLISPPVKGPVWVANFTLPFPPEDSVRQILLEVIDKFNDQRSFYVRPISTPISMEWVGFRKGVGKDEPASNLSEVEKYQGLMRDASGPGIIMFIYGGAFYMNNQGTYRKIISQLSARSGLPCVSFHQRLAPQNPFPAALLDVFHGYMALLSPPLGSPHPAIPASSIVIAGDSSGGCLALGLLQVLLELKRSGNSKIQYHGRDVNIDLPAGLAIVSGVADLTNALPSHKELEMIDVMPPEPTMNILPNFPSCEIWPATPPRGNLYCDISMMRNPITAPSMATDWTGSPPLWFAAGQEQFSDGIKILVKAAVRQKVPVFFQEYENMPHCFMWIIGDPPQARRAWEGWADACVRLAKGGEVVTGAEFVLVKGLEKVSVPFVDLTRITDDEGKKIIRDASHSSFIYTGQKAIATFAYEWYYDLVLGGQFTFKLKELHEKYGPVIRVNPDELHFNDPDYYDEIFNVSNGKADKIYRVANAFGPYPAAIGTQGHDLHRLRRGALNVFFSKKYVSELVPHMQHVIDELCSRFKDACDTGEPINLKYAYSAATLDIMNEYCFSEKSKLVSKSDFGRKIFDDVDSFLIVSLVNVHIPWIMASLYSLPKLARQVEDIREEKDLSHLTSGHRTVFHDLIQSSLSPAEKSPSRLRDEAFSLITAGSGTSALVVQKLSYFIAANPNVQKKLLLELKQAIPSIDDHASLQALESLPYLNAVIREGLRLGHPITHRLSRTFQEKTLVYGEYTIPPGTNVNMTSMLIHENEDIFPDPKVFRPERWLNDKTLQRYLVPFSKGPRSCLGINLAWAELYLLVANVFRRYNFDVSGVIRERDIDVAKDIVLSVPRGDSPGVLVKIIKVDS
ncbi:hypothetical protein HYFRA_00013853 [Hymenoscyphus fraxineus]|uniref:Alpha/beta hydrolase fold-3 domain-containing protein n=1 Tax=Hymenoscyphus fraxineus TaxID=746836 RepID=A0A9N9LC65_9HELO|nr:hypothetical protein HYFRA_00013853 [Hymenoscyphus fraxineus]